MVLDSENEKREMHTVRKDAVVFFVMRDESVYFINVSVGFR